MTRLKRLRGLASLVQDAVEHGSAAVERVHVATARRPFTILERLPPTATPARVAHAVHDTMVASVYSTIRAVNRAVGATAGLAFDVAEHAIEEDP